MGTKSCTKTINNKPRWSHLSLPDLESIDEEAEREKRNLVSLSALTKQSLPAEHDPDGLYDDFTDYPGPEAVCPHASKNDCPEADMDDDCAIFNENIIDQTVSSLVNLNKDSQLITEIDEDEDVQLQAMFYLPKWDSALPPSSAKLLPERDASLKVILANVAELLSRSPPSLTQDLDLDISTALLPPSPQQLHQPFQVSFTLDVDDDDDDDEVMMSDAGSASSRSVSCEPPVDKEKSEICQNGHCEEPKPVSIAADSPTWDEVFGNEEENDNHEIMEDAKETDDEMYRYFKEEHACEQAEGNNEIKMKDDSMSKEKDSWENEKKEEMTDLIHRSIKDDRICQDGCQMDESMDLFGDDEAFMQVTIPDISTPGRTSACAGDISNSTKTISNTSRMHNSPNSCSSKHSDSTHRLNTVQTDDLAQTYYLTHTSHPKLITQATNVHNTSEHNTHTAAQSKSVTDNSVTENLITSHCKSHKVHQNDTSQDYFSVNFDLGYSLEDSEAEAEVVETVSAPYILTSPQSKKQGDSTVSLPAISNSSTPYNRFNIQRMPLQCSESKQSTPQMLTEHRKKVTSSFLTSPLMSKRGGLPSPITSPGARRMLMPGPGCPSTPSLLSTLKRRRMESRTTETKGRSRAENKSCQESICVSDSPARTGLFKNYNCLNYIGSVFCSDLV